jgi:hypothetical protein
LKEYVEERTRLFRVWVKLLEDLRLKWVHDMGMDNLKDINKLV